MLVCIKNKLVKRNVVWQWGLFNNVDGRNYEFILFNLNKF